MEAEAIADILALVRQRTGVDFSRYREATVQRRIRNRMISVGAATYDAYLKLLRASEDEARELLARISIKVSRFYRHAVAFDVLRDQVLPALAAGRPGHAVRIWSAGCGCGEEPYTLAMLLLERGLDGTVLGTDIDSGALQHAQTGVFPVAALCELPRALADRYLVPLRGHGRDAFGVCEAVRSRVRFVRHDLLFASAPERSAFDLVACRNVLIYLQREVREEAFRTLRGAVRPGGYLCLGEAEWPPEPLAHGLQPLSRPSRVFRIACEGSR